MARKEWLENTGAVISKGQEEDKSSGETRD